MLLNNVVALILCTSVWSASANVSLPNRSLISADHSNLFTELNPEEVGIQNLQRSMQLVDLSILRYFDPKTFEMRRFYNPFTQEKSEERASVWMYTAAIEAVNAILSGLNTAKEAGNSDLYDRHFVRYAELLDKLYENADYYLGTFELISYTQTKKWSVYAVDRVQQKGRANVTGVLNVYDDQMWLVRELLDSYKLTGKNAYLEKAEYLTAYVLDGWDATRDKNGKENGGIPWGPGYTTKHACSNAPMISPLVWLHELYKGKPVQIEKRYISSKDKKTRLTKLVNKQTYYLDYAKAIYDWQKTNLLNAKGVYSDMMGGCVPNCAIQYEEINGVKYRAHTQLNKPVGEAFTYNSGTMLSGAVDLFRATAKKTYAKDAQTLGDKSFNHFASLGRDIPNYYSFQSDGFKNWFNGILLRGYHDLTSLDNKAVNYLDAFQKNLDYGFEHFNHKGFLPTNMLAGWKDDKKGQGVEGMFMFTYAAQYAVLGKHHLESSH